MTASYAVSVRRASALPAASFRFHLAMDTLAVRLTVPPVGPVEDLHLQVNAPCRAHNKKGLCTGVPLAEAQSKRHLDRPLHGMPFLSWTRCILENRHWLDDAFSEHDCRSAAFYITTMHEQHKLSNKIINSGTAACPGCPSSGVRPSSGRPHAATSTNNWFIRQTHTLSVVAGRYSCK